MEIILSIHIIPHLGILSLGRKAPEPVCLDPRTRVLHLLEMLHPIQHITVMFSLDLNLLPAISNLDMMQVQSHLVLLVLDVELLVKHDHVPALIRVDRRAERHVRVAQNGPRLVVLVVAGQAAEGLALVNDLGVHIAFFALPAHVLGQGQDRDLEELVQVVDDRAVEGLQDLEQVGLQEFAPVEVRFLVRVLVLVRAETQGGAGEGVSVGYLGKTESK